VTLLLALRGDNSTRAQHADSSGFACGHASRYYVKRRAKGQNKREKPVQAIFYKRYAKLELVLDTASHAVIGALTGRGPSPDVDRLVPLLESVDPALRLEKLAADAGFDSEANHVFGRVACGIQTLMPALHGRKGKGPPKGRWRRRMRQPLSSKKKCRRYGYTRRVQVETGFSMIKRRQGESVAACIRRTQDQELRLMVLTHNLMISYALAGFSIEAS
jgi:hypothetical protein